MKELLQNHHGTRKFPVAGSFRNVMRQDKPGLLVTISWLLFTILFAALSFLALVFIIEFKSIISNENALLFMTLSISSIIILLISIFCFLNSAIKREQRNYYKLAGLTILPEEKRFALRLDLPMMYGGKGWTETLEYDPIAVRFDDKKPDFKYLYLAEPDEYLIALDNSWGILSQDNYLQMVDELFKGMHSCRFAYDMFFASNEIIQHKIKRLADLTKLDPQYIENCIAIRGNKPPKMLLGFDLRRIIWLSRTSFMAGLIDEELAWENILKAADWVHFIFADMDDYFDNCRLGHAYWCNSFEKTKERFDIYNDFKENCDWPQAKLPWPHIEELKLPSDIMDGFRSFIAKLLKTQQEDEEEIIEDLSVNKEKTIH